MLIRKLQFRLPTLFLIVTLLACGIVLLRYTWFTPTFSGTVYAAICTSKDWDTVARGFPGAIRARRGELTTWAFDFGDPQVLFKKFAQRPEIWGNVKVENANSATRSDHTYSMFGWSVYNRSATRPVEGWPNGFDASDLAIYSFEVQGTFLVTRLPPFRYSVDCFARIVVQRGATFDSERGYQLSYSGYQDVIVFAAPIDSDLVQLIVVDLR